MLGRIFRASRCVRVDAKPAATKASNIVEEFNVEEYLVKQGIPSFAKFEDQQITQEHEIVHSLPKIDLHAKIGIEPIVAKKLNPVYIYKAAANAMQNEYNDQYVWSIMDPMNDGSATDYLSGMDAVVDYTTYPDFNSIEEAVAYCDRQNITYKILKDNHRTYKHGKSYALNFRFKGDTPRQPF